MHTKFHTDHLEVDRIVRETMGKVYDGNVDATRKPLLLSTFLRMFGHHFPQRPPFDAPPITGMDLTAGIDAMAVNTPGLDGVTKGDLRILNTKGLDILARMFSSVEEGAPWPTFIRRGRTAFISKGER